MPYARPRPRSQQELYNQQLQQAYTSTRRVPPYAPQSPVSSRRDPLAEVRELAQLHESGVLTDAEFTAAKTKVLNAGDDAT
jgi:hypothetical protein